jgi:hypothetical protein
VLEVTRRGYTQQAYLDMVQRADIIPGQLQRLSVYLSVYMSVPGCLRLDCFFVICYSVAFTYLGENISFDFISGSCSETPEEHSDSIRLMREVKFEQAFMVRFFVFVIDGLHYSCTAHIT